MSVMGYYLPEATPLQVHFPGLDYGNKSTIGRNLEQLPYKFRSLLSISV